MKKENRKDPEEKEEEQREGGKQKAEEEAPQMIPFEVIRNMPEEMAKALLWIFIEYDRLSGICKNCEMTKEEIEEMMQKFSEKGEYFALALLQLAIILKENGQ